MIAIMARVPGVQSAIGSLQVPALRVGPATRAVDPDSAYEAVEAAYLEAKDAGLLEGPGVSVVGDHAH